jgi:hypothetical protein
MKRLFAIAAALGAAAACDRKPAEPAPSPAAPSATAAAPSPAPPPVAASAPVAAPAAPAVAGPIPAEATQLLLAIVPSWDAVDAELSLWTRQGAGAWHRAGAPWPAVIGSGAAWGAGLHGEGPPAGQDGPRKREGDGRSPAGVFALGPSWGYAEATVAGARWPYTQADRRWVCVDDGASKWYGQIIDSDQVTKDWSSHEAMRRKDELYARVVEVGHNPTRTAGAGSCIFLHVWRKAGSPTVGCTAMPKARLEQVLTWLDPGAKPVFALLPAPAARTLAQSWGLPPL